MTALRFEDRSCFDDGCECNGGVIRCHCDNSRCRSVMVAGDALSAGGKRFCSPECADGEHGAPFVE